MGGDASLRILENYSLSLSSKITNYIRSSISRVQLNNIICAYVLISIQLHDNLKNNRALNGITGSSLIRFIFTQFGSPIYSVNTERECFSCVQECYPKRVYLSSTHGVNNKNQP